MLNKTLKNKINYVLLPICFILVVFVSCRKNTDFITSGANFEISQDTLLFDTVFTTIGSATKRVKIYNNESDPILVDIRLKSGEQSMFRMNVDGQPGKVIEEVEIPGKDSIYVFMEVTVDPDQPLSISPYVIEDDLLISQNNSMSSMKLIAWGQNANYISKKGTISALTCDLGTVSFDDEKPYVIYGILVVDSCELIIPAGQSIHIHGGLVTSPDLVYNDGQIIIFPNGKLTVQGSQEEPVVFEGDRLEPDFSDVAGQWVGIRIFPESVGNSIEYAQIQNSIIGVIVDSSAELSIKNSIIKNTTGAGIIGVHSTIDGENLLVHSNGSYNVQLTYGGDYNFDYCTFVSSSTQREALYINNYKCTDLENDPLCVTSFELYRSNSLIRNSILYGPSKDEINIDDHTNKEVPNIMNFDFQNCIVRVDELIESENYPTFFQDCPSCITYMSGDSLFLNEDALDFSLDTMSIAEEKAISIQNIDIDILGNFRDISTPDIGCYEFNN